MINLRRAQKGLEKYLCKDLGLDDFKFQLESDNLTAKNSITIKDYDDGVFVEIIVFKSGSFAIDFVFDKLDKTAQALELIHEFNKQSVWLAAYIRNDGYLVLRYNVMQLSDDDVVDNVSSAFNKLLSDNIKKVLQPLTRLTYPAN